MHGYKVKGSFFETVKDYSKNHLVQSLHFQDKGRKEGRDELTPSAGGGGYGSRNVFLRAESK